MATLRMGRSLVGEHGLSVSLGKAFSYPVHSHSYFELILYHPFEGQVRINETVLKASQSFAVLMTPADLHGIEVWGASSDLLKIAFAPDLPGSYLLERLQSHPVLVTAPDNALTCLFEKLAEERPLQERILLLRALLLCLLEAGEPLPALPAAHGSKLILEAVSILQEEAHTDLTLGTLATRLNVSYQHLSTLFTTHLGLSFSAYLADIRLRNAMQMLHDSELSVSEICYECGYRNLSHFLRSFKQKFGITPKTYRKSKEKSAP